MYMCTCVHGSALVLVCRCAWSHKACVKVGIDVVMRLQAS